MRKIYFLIALFPTVFFAQSEKNACETLLKINNLIQKEHYKPKPVDDSLSIYVYNEFLKVLDEDHKIFIEPEIKNFEIKKYLLDNFILESNCAYFDEIYAIYSLAIARYSSIIKDLKTNTFAFSSDEKIKFSKKSFPYAKNEIDLKTIYRKSILFNILKDVAEISDNKDSLNVHFEKLASLSKSKIIENFECKSASLQLSKEEFYTKLYSVFCTYFDPHTNYFSASEKSSFLSSVSADNLTFGLYVSLNEKDEVVVNDIMAGSSAYFTEKIDSGDIILKIKLLNEEYTIACSSMDKIAEIISSTKYLNADVTLKKKSGEIYTVSLVKQVMKDYENNVYSYIIKKDNRKIGYIKIPSFYSTFENGTTSVTDDLVKEIFKLQADKVDGLLLDFENNGGGSMDEAVRMTGLFIDVGPLAVMKDSKGKSQTIKDTNRGIIYFGPIVIMINGFSASASEFFTNAMQDYNRAIVIGNKSLGKATMQRILPLNDAENSDDFVKLTIEKFYRITGKSNQYLGIKPDVEIPLLFDKQMPRESDFPTALKNDGIISNLKYPKINYSYDAIIENSKKRVAQSADLKAIEVLNDKINALYDNDLPEIELKFSTVFNEIKKINILWKEIQSINEVEYDLDVIQNATDIEYQQYDAYLKSSNKEKIKAIKGNLHILEGVQIINDIKP